VLVLFVLVRYVLVLVLVLVLLVLVLFVILMLLVLCVVVKGSRHTWKSFNPTVDPNERKKDKKSNEKILIFHSEE
jgi:hypothetical protein